VPFIHPSAAIIFITAHDEFAVRAFEINALDYLLKPVTDDRLTDSLQRLAHRQTIPPGTTGSPGAFETADSVFIRTDAGQLFVRLDRIMAIRSIGGNYAAIYLSSMEKLLSRKTLKEWAAILPESVFIRIHRSTIINTMAIERVLKDQDGSWRVCLSGQDDPIRVSRRLAPRLKRLAKKGSV
jgi:two-component system LytT family response regulator